MTNTTTLPIMLSVCLVAVATGQDTKSKTGFEWLRQFEGKWKVTSKQPGQDAVLAAGTLVAKPMSTQWMVCEQNANMGSMQFHSIQRIGYDKKTKKYIGSWFDSVSQFVWQYDGSLNDAGTTLTLNAIGPDWENATKNKDYRDIYEFKSETEIMMTAQIKNDEGKWDTFMTATMTKDNSSPKTSVTPFLMFAGQAVEAIEFYQSVFPGTEVLSMQKYGAAGPGKEGTVQLAEIQVAGQRIKIIDSPVENDFAFTPSFSLFVECENDDQIKKRFGKLSDGGKVMMPLGNHGFSKEFGWVSDKFGVSWQLNLK